MMKTKRLILAGLFTALGVVLPVLFHSIPNAGNILLPMHLPVLLCGLVCGWYYGAACGILTPLLSSLITSMPPMAILPSMICELAVYGLLAGLIFLVVKTGKLAVDLYLSLIGAMLAGRIVYGLLNALIFQAGSYSLSIWLTASFVTALPGIIIQLVLIPAIVLVLHRARLVPARAA